MVYTTHWIDETLRAQEAARAVDADVPDWANIELNPLDGPNDASVYGTKGVVRHLLDHRRDYDYDEFDRQLGVILENEASWIREERVNGLLLDDAELVAERYDENRRGFVDVVNLIDEANVAIPTRGFKAMAELDDDGFMRENMGPYGRRYAQAVVGDISRERVSSGRVPVPDDMGFDFSKGASLSPQQAREITRDHDAQRMAERQEQLRREVVRDLNSITGPMSDEEDFARLESGRSQAEIDAEGVEDAGYRMTPESIEELLAEYDNKTRKPADFDRTDLDPSF